MVDIRPDKYPETALRTVLDVPYTYVFDFFSPSSLGCAPLLARNGSVRLLARLTFTIVRSSFRDV